MSRNDAIMISQWNAEGIAALQLGQYKLAVSTFKKALKHFAQTEETTDSMDIDRADMMSQKNCVRSVCISAESTEDDALTKPDDLDNALFDFFPKAFEIDSFSQSCLDNRLSVILLYNMALAIDTMAQEVTDNKSVAVNGLTKMAMNLYATARDLLLLHWVDSNNGKVVAGMRTVLLATMINLGRLQSQHMSFAETRMSLMAALDLLLASDATVQMENEDFDQLSLSVAAFIYMQRDTILSVAPAA